MNYQFYQGSTSPFVRKVRILLEELNLMDQVELVVGLDPEKLEQHPNPLIKIPALITPDAGIIYDSTVIAEYLDHKFAPGKYFPKNFSARLKVLVQHALVVGAIEACVAIVYEKRRPSNLQSAEFMEKQKLKVVRSIKALAPLTDYFTRNWNLDTIALICFLDYLDFRFPGEYDCEEYKILKAWRATVKNEAVDKTMPQ